MKTKTWQEIRAKGRTPEQLAAIDADVAEEAKRIMGEPINLVAIEACYAKGKAAHESGDENIRDVMSAVLVSNVPSLLAAVRERDAEIERLRACNMNLRRTLDDRGAALERAEDGEAKALTEASRLRDLLAPVQDAARAMRESQRQWPSSAWWTLPPAGRLADSATMTIADEKPAPVGSEAERQEMLKAGR